MKKFMFVAMIATLCMSCTSESYFEEVSPEEQNVNKFEFDLEEKNEANFQTFVAACKSIIQVHRELETFRDVLTDSQLEVIDSKKFNLDEAVKVIFVWWEKEETHDTLVEWPEYDDFFLFLPKKYWEQSPIYW